MTVRAPEVRPAYGAGLGIVDPRSLRIRVDDDGVLTVTRPGKSPVVVSSAGSATRAVWVAPEEARKILSSVPGHVVATLGEKVFGRLDRWKMRRMLGPELYETYGVGSDPDAYAGAVVIYESDVPVLSFYVAQFTPWSGDLPIRRETSGAVALVRGLGLVLERREASDVLERRAVRAVHVELSRGHRGWLPGSTLLCVAGIALAFLSWPFGGTGAGALMAAGSLVVTAPVLWYLVHMRRRFLELVTTPPAAGDRTIYRPPGLTAGNDVPQLQLGTHDVVVVTGGGDEWWLPGPALGGVQRCEVGSPDVHLIDARGRILHILVTAEVAPHDAREQLAEICSSVGIQFTLAPGMGNSTSNRPIRVRFDKEWPPALLMGYWEQGRIGVVPDTFVLVALLVLVPGAIAAAVSVPPWGFLVLAGSLVWLGARIWTSLSYWRWQRRVIRHSAEQTKEA